VRVAEVPVRAAGAAQRRVAARDLRRVHRADPDECAATPTSSPRRRLKPSTSTPTKVAVPLGFQPSSTSWSSHRPIDPDQNEGDHTEYRPDEAATSDPMLMPTERIGRPHRPPRRPLTGFSQDPSRR
jgi:hypothetical protein